MSGLTDEQLRIICDMTVRLTELKQNKVNHLAVENSAPEIFQKLLSAFELYQAGKINIDWLECGGITMMDLFESSGVSGKIRS